MSHFSPEALRLNVLHSYDILDTPETKEFDNLVTLAAQICEVPIAKINFIDDKRTWSKANYGNDLKESPREFHFCNTTIRKEEFMIVEDASVDDRFSHFDFVANDPKLRFYAGVNIRRDQQNLGTICVLGQEPKQLSEDQLNALRTLASEIEARLELHKKNRELETTAAFLEASVDLLLVLDPDTLLVEKANRNGSNLLSELSGQDFFKPLDELFPDSALISELRHWIKNGSNGFESETSLKTAAGEVFLELNGIRKEDKLLITAKDITRRKQAERELRKEKLFSEKIIQSLPLNFFMFDENQNLIKWSRNHATHGYSDEEYAERTPLDFFEGDDQQSIREYIEQVFAGDKSQGSIEADLIQKDGSKKPFLFNAVRFEQGDKKYLIGTSQSIEAQRRYQEKLEGLLAEKEVLLAEVHHRVKNNLAVISGFLQMQEFVSEDESVKSALLTNHMRVKSMALIHEDLYNVSNFNGIRFDHYLAQLLEFIEDKRNPKNKFIKLKKSIGRVEMNVNQAVPLALIVNELVSNAYEFAFEGRESGTITVDLKAENDTVSLSVKDNGIGLPEGFELENSPTLGTTLVLSYSEQINSKIDINTGKEGTEYRLMFNHLKNQKGSTANVLV
ncbi:MAG: PAS domain S-box protein [Gracilimonas sp.]|uniref:histidine kinase dimerization/phosphoacceptor domain -containing protein n=1 Tax=Gracilimonas TaxID=649462 RepID=UPI001B01B6CE|nr:histidine kinase dimerization/phosphoacceptor domain -containing protein [Gracilimonas sp.]MBO6586115.1 PAS domain S-box protein [Gracilimonas sp.]MBO6614772.1 PAS domain S-box protein [Gracilimonas sp.]